MSIKLNEEQESAIEMMSTHISSADTFMVLEGSAGTGKTTCLRQFLLNNPEAATVCCAPTNKATKVIRSMIGDLVPSCTIYKLLGLQMTTEGEIKVLSGLSQDLDLSDCDVIVIDEAGMLNSKIMEYINQTALENPRIRWIFMGDRFQLPPVGEVSSPVWSVEKRASLTKVMRHDNQILTLATHVRGLVEFGGPLLLAEDHDTHGVWKPKGGLNASMLADAEAFRTGESKAIAWRNATVETMNRIIRQELLENPFECPWQVGERITLLEPAKDLAGDFIASTDEEGEITHVSEVRHPLYSQFKAYRIAMTTDDGEGITLFVPHESESGSMTRYAAELAAAAKVQRSRWRNFWNFKEAWANVRHAYATTAHRSQGSSYGKAYVCWTDVMLNRSRTEALRCLYVGVSRPRLDLYLG